ncbi:hypothetical protein BTA51_20055 [Hahella sp. CCB-MM4]|uniref:hypothetical protein n=1 Tax=Hahella sp. (strain CCB-MM4) TaxID=1926491 RepID=UPI000B9BB533|nr:hypothetical protein [Hahella sp. CCB-MM4]OZG71578.1 hypothetical protein BTA51_20055 [Hahella sp. CCB-MM4]
MNKPIYDPPKSDLLITAQVEIPEKLINKINNGAIAATVLGVLVLGLILLYSSSRPDLGSDYLMWLGFTAAVCFALAYGIYRKSRVASTLMFFLFLLIKILIWIQTGSFDRIFMSAIFLYFLFRAMAATFQYHKRLKEAEPAA